MTHRRFAVAGVVMLLALAPPVEASAVMIIPGPAQPWPAPQPAGPVPAAACTPNAPVNGPQPAPPAPGVSCPYFSLPGIGGVVGAVSGGIVQVVLGAMVQWVADGAASLLSGLAGFISQVTAPDVGASWFQTHYRVMAEIALLLVLPLILGAALTAIVRQDSAVLLRSVVFHLPLAAVGTFLATQLVALALGATDELCAIVVHNDAGGTSQFLTGMGSQVSGLSSQSGVAGFAVVVVAIVLIVGALAVLLELLMRTAAVYVTVLFLPIVLAGLVWPATLRWARRLVELLAVLVLSKFVIVAVLSLAASALSSGLSGGGLAALLGGASLLLLAAFAPYTLLRLVPFVEAGAAGHLEGVAASLPRRAVDTAHVPGNVVNDLLGRGSDGLQAPGGGGGVADVRTAEGAARLDSVSGANGPHIADGRMFDATRGAGAEAGGEAGVAGVAGAAFPVAVAVAGRAAATVAHERVIDAAEGAAPADRSDHGD